MRARGGAAIALAALVATSAAWAALRDEERFPHREHAEVFPTCVGCHEGIVTGAEADAFPAPSECADCHDGRDLDRVNWDGPRRDPSNLKFSHVEHARESELPNDTRSCQRCHAAGGDTTRAQWMAVREAQPPECLSCHEHRATEHLARDSDCQTCHLTLVAARELPDSVIADFPYPPSHEAPDFITRHAPSSDDALAQCAVCHARESCERCHVNAPAVRAIGQLGSDPRVARLASRLGAEYPLPESHLRETFVYDHGRVAADSTASCANCHAQPSCRSCHIGQGARRAIARLPVAREGGPQGVQLRGEPGREWRPPFTGSERSPDGSGAAGIFHRTAGTAPDYAMRARGDTIPVRVSRAAAPRDTTRRVRGPRTVSVHPADYVRMHGPDAATQSLDCEGCHQKQFCSNCHQGEGARRYHPPNFAVRHPSDAYGRERECSTCHNTEAFCKECHQSVGIGAQGRLDVGFHTAQPVWLLQHGRAARQGMESCATCHRQADCMQCHSTAGWSVNPHGADFDARAMQGRNPTMCRTCHFGDPLR
jgi:hypothetical protein